MDCGRGNGSVYEIVERNVNSSRWSWCEEMNGDGE